jgi:hypothetical protein
MNGYFDAVVQSLNGAVSVFAQSSGQAAGILALFCPQVMALDWLVCVYPLTSSMRLALQPPLALSGISTGGTVTGNAYIPQSAVLSLSFPQTVTVTVSQ